MRLFQFFLGLNAILVYADKCTWDNCPKWDHKKLNIHFVAHTHNDLGWISTFDELYLRGPWKPSRRGTGVKSIINTIVYELNNNITRKFSYSETGYLKRWMDDYGEYGYKTMKNFVQSGRLEIAGGGWVQPDEATAHYVEIIDMYTMSLRFLNETFGKCGHPKVAWQIDSFGHSKEHANLIRLMGYEYLWLCREHFREHKIRQQNRTLTMLWHVSDDNKETIYTEQNHWHTHKGPVGFCWEGQYHPACNDNEFNETPHQGKVNVDEILEKFLQYIIKRYSNILSAFYSTPSCYFKAVGELKNIKLAKKQGDFFPYATQKNQYWAGYFTSKPAIKGLVRQTSSLLQLTRQLSTIALISYSGLVRDQIDELERSLAISVSHDAVSGTSKEKVTQDFIHYMTKGWNAAEQVINSAMKRISKNLKNHQLKFPKQIICRKINESECAFTRTHSNFHATIHNGNSRKLTTLIRIPLYENTNSVSIKDELGTEIEHQVVPVFNNDNQLNNTNMANNEIHFMANIDPLGYQTYFISISKKLFSFYKKYEHKYITSGRFISNELIKLEFDSHGHLSTYHDLTTGKTYSLKQEFHYYRGKSAKDATWELPPSGAYYFRPLNQTFNFSEDIGLTIINEKIVKEARQIVSPWVSQIIRLIPNKNIVEFEWTIGPISKAYHTSKEVITRYTIKDLKTNGVFWTDSNGRQLMKRTRNNHNNIYKYENTEPIAGNYYPITNKVIISDNKKSMAILTERAQGCSSLTDGQIEIMLHRRDLYDDMLGMFEKLDEPGHDGRGLVVRGKHWLILGDAQKITRLHRSLAYDMFHSYWITFSSYDSDESYRKNFVSKFSGLKKPLPENVNLLTLKQLSPDEVLIRLEHIYQAKEDDIMSRPVTIDLENLIYGFEIISIMELNLAANKFIAIINDTIITLKPMEIKTYQLKVSSYKSIKSQLISIKSQFKSSQNIQPETNEKQIEPIEQLESTYKDDISDYFKTYQRLNYTDILSLEPIYFIEYSCLIIFLSIFIYKSRLLYRTLCLSVLNLYRRFSLESLFNTHVITLCSYFINIIISNLLLYTQKVIRRSRNFLK